MLKLSRTRFMPHCPEARHGSQEFSAGRKRLKRHRLQTPKPGEVSIFGEERCRPMLEADCGNLCIEYEVALHLRFRDQASQETQVAITWHQQPGRWTGEQRSHGLDSVAGRRGGIEKTVVRHNPQELADAKIGIAQAAI